MVRGVKMAGIGGVFIVLSDFREFLASGDVFILVCWQSLICTVVRGAIFGALFENKESLK